MTVLIPYAVIAELGGAEAFDDAVAEFREQVFAHALTVDVPAPTADALVAYIVGNNLDYEFEPAPTG